MLKADKKEQTTRIMEDSMGLLAKYFFVKGLMGLLDNKGAAAQNVKTPASGGKPSSVVFCEYCGQKFSSAKTLINNNCPRHPAGSMKGKHKLYEGSEKSQYLCKYCGQKFSSIQSLTTNKCFKHPSGAFQGRHSPAL